MSSLKSHTPILSLSPATGAAVATGEPKKQVKKV